MKKKGHAVMATILALAHAPMIDMRQRVAEERLRPCRNECGNLTNHKRGFCSADCCREYRSKS